MHRLTALLTLLSLVLLLFGSITSPATAQGNSEHAKRCQKGGWEDLAPSETPTVPFANQDECVRYGAQGGTIVGVQEAEIFLTFRVNLTDPNYCDTEVHLRNFAPNTTYTVTAFRREVLDPGFVQTILTTQVTTDAAGSTDYLWYSINQHNFDTRVVTTTGVDSGWIDVAC
jgi:hypothetical protein